MEKIVIGLIIGAIVLIIPAISKSNSYNPTQKIILYLTCVLFLPLGLVLLGVFSAYNKANL